MCSSIILLISCTTSIQKSKLPFFGEPKLINGDSVYPTIQNFTFIDQENKVITNNTFKDKIYVADFIFLSCPSICPKMNESMLNAYKAFEMNNNVLFLSHTIDPEHDSISKLKSYAENLKVNPNKWHFVTGSKDSIYHISEKSYFSAAYQDSTAPGGYTHSGGLLLIDKSRHIRGVYDGTNSAETERLISDIKTLLKEEF